MAGVTRDGEGAGSRPPRKDGEDGKGGEPDGMPDLGPTGPASAEGERPGPHTGGYDRQSPDRSSDNAKGGYGAG